MTKKELERAVKAAANLVVQIYGLCPLDYDGCDECGICPIPGDTWNDAHDDCMADDLDGCWERYFLAIGKEKA